MIQVSHLYKSFEDKEVLTDINATFKNGQINLIIGQSGSGKTVLMKNIVGLLTPTKGQIFYDDRDFVSLSKKEKILLRREMGMIFQSAALFDSLTVLENVMFPLDMFSDMSRDERVKRAQHCLERVNLKGTDNKLPAELSGGMQKRVAIARAIVLQPRYLFCDEPNSGLDRHRRTHPKYHARRPNHNHCQHPRHEFRHGNWREHHFHLRRTCRMARLQPANKLWMPPTNPFRTSSSPPTSSVKPKSLTTNRKSKKHLIDCSEEGTIPAYYIAFISFYSS